MEDVSEMSVMETIERLRAFEESSKGRCHDKEGEPQLLFVNGEPRLTRAEWEAKVAEEKRSGGGSSSGGSVGTAVSSTSSRSTAATVVSSDTSSTSVLL
jgi:hypothetical protein